MISYFSHALRWETLVLVWLTVIVMTTCHEFAHGLTCKRYGGQVHEIGFLMLFFMPCFYCNVSDAWLFREQRKRLWVTMAGGYCDLCFWALAVFVWRLTYQDSLLNYLAWVVLSVCGVRALFNFNPLLKLDGYYLLSDLMEIHNLRQRGLQAIMGRLRWLLWGAPRPDAQPRGAFLCGYGLVCWLFSLAFISLLLVGLGKNLGSQFGVLGVSLVAVLGLSVSCGLLDGLFAGEFTKMIVQRHRRSALWLTGLTGLIAVMMLVPMQDRAGGTFEIRPVIRAELRAPVAGFLEQVCFNLGEQVSSGALVGRLDVPDLASRIARKQAEVHEAEARLRLLQAGPRPEEVVQQRLRVQREEHWTDLARRDLKRQQAALKQELARFDQQLVQYQAEREYAKHVLDLKETLLPKNTISQQEYQQAKKEYRVCCALCEQTIAEKQARQSRGTLVVEAVLAKREKLQADEQAVLVLLEAGTRPEEIQAAQANLARLQEEAHYLLQIQARLALHSPVPGLVITPRLQDKIGDYFEEGELICEIEHPDVLEAEIVVAEQAAARVQPGQTVRLKARALPFETFQGKVDRIAPKAVSDELQSTVTIYCTIEDNTKLLRSGMTGYGRINCGRGPVGVILAKRCLRLLRTEFWW